MLIGCFFNAGSLNRSSEHSTLNAFVKEVNPLKDADLTIVEHLPESFLVVLHFLYRFGVFRGMFHAIICEGLVPLVSGGNLCRSREVLLSNFFDIPPHLIEVFHDLMLL